MVGARRCRRIESCAGGEGRIWHFRVGAGELSLRLENVDCFGGEEERKASAHYLSRGGGSGKWRMRPLCSHSGIERDIIIDVLYCKCRVCRSYSNLAGGLSFKIAASRATFTLPGVTCCMFFLKRIFRLLKKITLCPGIKDFRNHMGSARHEGLQSSYRSDFC